MLVLSWVVLMLNKNTASTERGHQNQNYPAERALPGIFILLLFPLDFRSMATPENLAVKYPPENARPGSDPSVLCIVLKPKWKK